MDAEHPPKWLDDVAGWLVTMSEGRFGLCRMLLWMRTAAGTEEEEASVVMPHQEYTQVERGAQVSSDDHALFTVLWRHGLLPTERPTENTPAPAVDGRRQRWVRPSARLPLRAQKRS
jgi:hypothetical protein